MLLTGCTAPTLYIGWAALYTHWLCRASKLEAIGEVESLKQLTDQLRDEYSGDLLDRLVRRGAKSGIDSFELLGIQNLRDAFQLEGSASVKPAWLCEALVDCPLPEVAHGSCRISLHSTALCDMLATVLKEPAVLWMPTPLALRHLRAKFFDWWKAVCPESERASGDTMQALRTCVDDVVRVAVLSSTGKMQLALRGLGLLGETISQYDSTENSSLEEPASDLHAKPESSGAAISEIREVFNELSQGGGVLNVHDLQLAVWRLGIALTQEEAVAAMGVLDTDSSKTISFDEFSAFYNSTIEEEQQSETACK